jgi:hypothetical protein
MKVGVQRLLAAVVVVGGVLTPAWAAVASGPFDLVRGWSGGPWDYQYPWAGCGYPTFGFGSPYTWDQPLGFGQAGHYIWGAPFASPALYLPKAPEEPEAGTGPQPPATSDPSLTPDGGGEMPAAQ